MKLAIVVVYIVEEHHGRLLDLHLTRIERHTTMPWTIYGSTNRLLPRFRSVLEQRSTMRLFEFPETELRGTPEHSYYLERLIRAAIDDGASHVVTMHVDSFPIADGWDQQLALMTQEPIAFATLHHINTACLFFPREFYVSHRPTLLVPGELQSGPAWESYLREHDPIPHSGIGYGFAAHRAGLRWASMAKATASDHPGAPDVFDDMLVHLGGALRLTEFAGQSTPLLRKVGFHRASAFAQMASRFIRTTRSITPRPIRRLLHPLVPRTLDQTLAIPKKRLQADLMSTEIEKLLADPDAYLAALRG